MINTAANAAGVIVLGHTNYQTKILRQANFFFLQTLRKITGKKIVGDNNIEVSSGHLALKK